MSAGDAWYASDRVRFIRDDLEVVVATLAGAAVKQGLHVEPEQHAEWASSVGLLQSQLTERVRQVEILREALSAPDLSDYRHVILEYDFRRRGLRLDCVLLGSGIVVVVEFKRSTITAADRDQVTNYCVNLVEFHKETRRACETDGGIVAPVLALTSGEVRAPVRRPAAFHRTPWGSVVRDPLVCDAASLGDALRAVLGARRGLRPVESDAWLASRFAPSSTIARRGDLARWPARRQRDLSACRAGRVDRSMLERSRGAHPAIEARPEEPRHIRVRRARRRQDVVGLKLAFDPRFRDDAVFVTGKAPLVTS